MRTADRPGLHQAIQILPELRGEDGGISMDDLISRQAAIEKISETIWDTAVANDVKTILKELPSVTPKQKRGKWINGYCSECGKHAPFWAMASTYYKSSFCPNCGAKMDGEVEGRKK